LDSIASGAHTGDIMYLAHSRRRIAIDMDEVLADALTEQLARCTAAFGRPFTADLTRGRFIEDIVEPHEVERAVSLLDASFFAGLAVMPDAQDVVRELARHHDVFIATAAMDVPISFDAKFQWLAQHFPFIPPSHIVFCGDKSVIDADDLIDDSPRHFARFRGRGILFSAPHNVHETRYLRVDSWEDVRRLYFGETTRVEESQSPKVEESKPQLGLRA
jgi:5'(3')-deoxyribonucleotidase